MAVKNCKAKGTKNEHKSIKLLEASGYRCCRSAASLGEWDIVGIGTTDVVLVQVKSNRPPCKQEMDRLKAFYVPANVKRVLHIWKDYAREPIARDI